MTFFHREKDNLILKNIADQKPFKYGDDIEIITQSDSKLIVGSDNQRNNLTLKYPGRLGGGGLYVNNPETPILEVDTNLNVLIHGIIVEDIKFEDVETNILRTKDTGQVVHESYSIFEEAAKVVDKVLISEDITTNPSDNDAQIHISSIGSTRIFLESDTDNITETDLGFLYFSEDAGQTTHIIRGGNNEFLYQTGTTAGPTGHRFQTGAVSGQPKGSLPVYASTTDLFFMGSTGNISYNDLDMLGNDILNVATISGQGGNLTINTDINLANKDILGAGDIYIRGMLKNSGQPNIEVGDDIDMLGNNIENVGSIISTSDITMSPTDFLLMDSEKNIALNDGYLSFANPIGIAPPAPSGFQGFLYKFGTDLFYKSGGGTFNLSRPYETKGVVTQITSISTGVVINDQTGTITTVNATLLGNTSVSFTVTNNQVLSTSVVLANITNYSGTYATDGFPQINIGAVVPGVFVIHLQNVHLTNALNGILKISFAVL